MSLEDNIDKASQKADNNYNSRLYEYQREAESLAKPEKESFFTRS